MTTVRKLHRADIRRTRVEGKLRWAALVCLTLVTPAMGQDGPVHWRHAGAMPPGAIGRQRLLRGGPLSGYCQPVEIRAPQGARISTAAGQDFTEPQRDKLMVGLSIGPVYRFRVTDIPDHPGIEVFPTVELVDRLYPPPGHSRRFPVPVDLTADELLMAAEGKFVTRVIYLEDPQLALPVAEKAGSPTRWFEVRPGDDPLVTADSLGRPVAILRMGSRLPEIGPFDDAFLYGATPAPVLSRPTAPGVVGIMAAPFEQIVDPPQFSPADSIPSH